MADERVVYELKRDGRRVYCSSFAVVVALLDMGWAFSDSGEWSKFVSDVANGASTRAVAPVSSSCEEAD